MLGAHRYPKSKKRKAAIKKNLSVKGGDRNYLTRRSAYNAGPMEQDKGLRGMKPSLGTEMKRFRSRRKGR